MSYLGHAAIGDRLPASAPAGVAGATSGPVPDDAAATTSAVARAQIGQLLSNAVNQLLGAGLELASVRCRLREADEHGLLEHLTDQLDATLVDIRHLSVRIALGADTAGEEFAGLPRF